MMTEQEIDSFLNLLKKKIARKAKLYDGHNSVDKASIDRFFRSVTEEIGEVSSELTRERWLAAMEECIDVVHSFTLLYHSIKRKYEEEQ